MRARRTPLVSTTVNGYLQRQPTVSSAHLPSQTVLLSSSVDIGTASITGPCVSPVFQSHNQLVQPTTAGTQTGFSSNAGVTSCSAGESTASITGPCAPQGFSSHIQLAQHTPTVTTAGLTSITGVASITNQLSTASITDQCAPVSHQAIANSTVIMDVPAAVQAFSTSVPRPQPSSAINTLVTASDLWDPLQPPTINPRAIVSTLQVSNPKRVVPNLIRSEKPAAMIEPLLPFECSDDMGGFEIPAKPVLKPGLLRPSRFVLPNGKCFLDKVLPRPSVQLLEHTSFNASYFIDLHHKTIAPGQRGQYVWKKGTPNYLGARIPLQHVRFNLSKWRKCLIGYENVEILQFLEFGFPLGLESIPTLSPALANHGSAYQYYPWLDKFFASGLLKGGVTGPCGSSPFSSPMVSPMMTAFKKPDERRAVFDATFGLHSLNNSTPSNNYLGEKCIYTFPKLEDFQRLILKCGRGCMLWKRDLARYYLQLPLDPTEYHYTGAVWRGLFFFFTALMFGLRHSGLQGQRVSDALAWIHRNQGLDYLPQEGTDPVISVVAETRNRAIVPTLDPDRPLQYNCVNYCDDLAGCEKNPNKANSSFLALGQLMDELGLDESFKKASGPSTRMVFLGVHFDTNKMTMSVPAEKIQELRADLDQWQRKTTTVRKDL